MYSHKNVAFLSKALHKVCNMPGKVHTLCHTNRLGGNEPRTPVPPRFKVIRINLHPNKPLARALKIFFCCILPPWHSRFTQGNPAIFTGRQPDFLVQAHQHAINNYSRSQWEESKAEMLPEGPAHSAIKDVCCSDQENEKDARALRTLNVFFCSTVCH